MSDIVPYQNYQKIVSYGRSPEVMQTFSLLLGRNAPIYIQSAITAVQANDLLLQCTPRSIFSSALRAATLRLSCDPAIGHAWLVPYKNNKKGIYEAQFQAGWRGVQHMALRTGKYRYINVGPVYEGEEVVVDRITGSLKIEGGVTSPKKEKGLIASFALHSGLQKSIYMTNEEMEEHGKRYSKGYNKADGIWMTNKPAAYHKTILLKLLRTYGYLDPSDAAILDDEQPEINDFVLPDETEVTIVESKPITAAEANKILGFDDEDENGDQADNSVIEEPEAKPEPKLMPSMTIEEAVKVQNSEGVPYGNITTDKLMVMTIGIKKALKAEHPDDEREVYQRKLEAINVILKARQSGEIAQSNNAN